MTKSELRSLLGDGKTNQVLVELRNLSADIPDLHNEILLISAQLSENDRQKRLNIAEPEFVKIELNRLNSVIIKIIDLLPDDSLRKPDKPNLEILFFDKILGEDYKTDIVSIFRYDNLNSGFLAIPIRFKNSGTKSIEELEIYWVFKPNTFLPFKEGVFKDKDLSETKKIREFTSTETGTYIIYKFGSIHPGVVLGFGELFRLLKTEVQNGYPIKITFAYKNAKPITIDFNLYVRESLNFEELEKLKSEHVIDSNYIFYTPKIIQQKDAVGHVMHIGLFKNE